MSLAGTASGPIAHATPAQMANTSGTITCTVAYDTSGARGWPAASRGSPATSIEEAQPR